jgi:hypothetical protein
MCVGCMKGVLAACALLTSSSCYQIHGLKISDVHPTEIARQLTLMEYEIYCSIAPSECLNQGWTRATKHDTSPHIMAMIEHFNIVTRWLAIEILAPEDVHDRAAAMHRIIVVAEECRVLHNYNGVMTILAGLQSTPIYRLKKTWSVCEHVVLCEFSRVLRTLAGYVAAACENLGSLGGSFSPNVSG